MAYLAEMFIGWWGVLGPCLVKVSARLVEVWPSYGQKTAKNWEENAIFGAILPGPFLGPTWANQAEILLGFGEC